jgi:hypothetical protein
MVAVAHGLADGGRDTGARFLAASSVVVFAAAALAGLFPISFSIATVFLFAGPHNWMEFRYFLTRLPARLGQSKAFFALAAGGVLLLLPWYLVFPLVARMWGSTGDWWLLETGAWNTAVLLWIAGLAVLRGRQRPRRDMTWVLAPTFLLIALNWLAPFWASLALVYVHPLVALWFLERVLRQRHSHYLRPYHRLLGVVAVAVLAIGLSTAALAAELPADPITSRITWHAGAGFVSIIPASTLVATHSYLESVHYAVWLVAIPLLGMRSNPFDSTTIPLYGHRRGWPRTIRFATVAMSAFVLALWAGFALDYGMTRDIYFALAMGHVLVEVPFLIRTL